jgi:hypothetical protein
LLNSARIELLALPRLVAQLCGLERRTAREGRGSIDHAPGGHDDIANSAMGALLLAGAAPGPMVITAQDIEVFKRPYSRPPLLGQMR